jgi:hypothetical protein
MNQGDADNCDLISDTEVYLWDWESQSTGGQDEEGELAHG